MTINEKAAYIKGIADGVELDNSTKEGKLIAALIDFKNVFKSPVARKLLTTVVSARMMMPTA